MTDSTSETSTNNTSCVGVIGPLIPAVVTFPCGVSFHQEAPHVRVVDGVDMEEAARQICDLIERCLGMGATALSERDAQIAELRAANEEMRAALDQISKLEAKIDAWEAKIDAWKNVQAILLAVNIARAALASSSADGEKY